ncbi:MAG: hypothetical protein RR368_02940, partial [Oscillospiraceae bacterium]
RTSAGVALCETTDQKQKLPKNSHTVYLDRLSATHKTNRDGCCECKSKPYICRSCPVRNN